MHRLSAAACSATGDQGLSRSPSRFAKQSNFPGLICGKKESFFWTTICNCIQISPSALLGCFVTAFLHDIPSLCIVRRISHRIAPLSMQVRRHYTPLFDHPYPSTPHIWRSFLIFVRKAKSVNPRHPFSSSLRDNRSNYLSSERGRSRLIPRSTSREFCCTWQSPPGKFARKGTKEISREEHTRNLIKGNTAPPSIPSPPQKPA